jgi:hypothetical protein
MIVIATTHTPRRMRAQRIRRCPLSRRLRSFVDLCAPRSIVPHHPVSPSPRRSSRRNAPEGGGDVRFQHLA